MKFIKNILIYSSLLLLVLSVVACSTKPKPEAQPDPVKVADIPAPSKDTGPKPLPVQYQTPSYEVDQQHFEEAFSEEKTSIKVGATIRSNRGAMPLGDILTKLAALKDMNVSWASDVDRDVTVDVNIQANDDFYDAIDNMLRQVDYFHEMEGSTIIVRYKETRQFHVAMPFIKSNYRTSAGGNLLGNNEESESIDGTVQLTSEDNAFDIWDNIQANMDAILETWNTSVSISEDSVAQEDDTASVDQESPDLGEPANETATRRYSSGGNMYIIDRPIGVITVSAPRPLLDRIENYLNTLKKELYKQIAIDAKIIEVVLNDSSSIGIDWTNALKGFSASGAVAWGTGGVIYDRGEGFNLSPDTISLGNSTFDIALNLIKEQGDAKVLSNPKLSVMNGQPALISVGQSITYISEIEADRDTDNGTITYTTETDSLLSGLGLGITATILENNQIIMNLIPVTSELSPFSADSPIEYRDVGSDGGQVGLPVVNIREMSTTVRVKDNDTLIIGGLITEVTDDKSSAVPVLGSIPGLKYLFSNENKSLQKKELVILIKPRII